MEDITVMNNPHAVAGEAEKVLQTSPKWQPGMLRGRPINVVYNVPVSFSLPR